MAIDVANDAGGRAKLLALGVRTVPVVALGTQYVFAQNLEDVAEFVGLQGTGHTPLPPDVLIERWTTLLRTAQRYIRQFPASRMGERVIDNRDRSIGSMGHHVFRIAEAFLEAVEDGVDYTPQLASAGPEAVDLASGREIAAYGDKVIARLERWWAGLADRTCRAGVKTFFGTQPVAALFERSTWHSGQHVRQLAAVLERYGIEPDGRLAAATLAGLPLPEGLWE